ncbi:hypothetical protein CGZ80_17015 [Rhodopirellula sp. MGV]|nr:hypothetical protein CGZ80_17015 [Rhodopirellula sp. MGV]
MFTGISDVEHRFNPADAQTYFSTNFWKNHIFVGSELNKKKAEVVFQRRGVDVSSVICMTRSELIMLASDLHNRQAEFARGGPNAKYISRVAFDIWQRGGPRSRDRQAASHTKSKFEYKVRSTNGGRIVVCHYEGTCDI